MASTYEQRAFLLSAFIVSNVKQIVTLNSHVKYRLSLPQVKRLTTIEAGLSTVLTPYGRVVGDPDG